jgi:hypothetical protein
MFLYSWIDNRFSFFFLLLVLAGALHTTSIYSGINYIYYFLSNHADVLRNPRKWQDR